MNDTKPASGKGWKIALGLFIPLIVILPLWFFFLGPQIRHDRLVEKGIHAPGRLLSVEETGTYVNDSPELELVVSFTRKEGALDTATTDFVPSLRSLHLFQPGAIVTVAYDPDEPEEITIVDLSVETSGVRGGQADRDVAIDSLRRSVDSLRRELERAKAGVKEGAP